MSPLRVLRLHEIGCIACRKEGYLGVPPELHHPTAGGRRLSDDIVVPLCPWHHQGKLDDRFQCSTEARMKLGPSLAKSKREFVARYGTELELVAEVDRIMEQRYGVHR